MIAATLAICAGLGSVPAAAQDPEPDSQATSSPVTFRWNIEWISAVRGVAPAETAINPGNAVLRIPQLAVQTEVRPNLRLELGPRLQVIARPRVRASLERASATALAVEQEEDAEANWTELYASWRPVDALAIAWGLQNFQWGPAELLSPSNRIFHETGVFRDQVYYVRGRHLLRINMSPGRQWSVVAFAEVGANGEAAFRAGERFRRAAQAKLEYTAADGASYVGLVAGARHRSRPWAGGYAALALGGGLSAYADVSVQRGSIAWYPVHGARTVGFDQTLANDARARWFGITGLRYAFVNGTDARVEYVHQDAGWARSQLDLAAAVLAATPSRAAFDASAAPGLEFLGRRLVLLSVRRADMGPGKRTQVQGRYLRSFTDSSGVVFVTTSLNTTGALVVFASAAATHGSSASEFARLVRASLAAGAVYAW
jgi:hypothetical protein